MSNVTTEMNEQTLKSAQTLKFYSPLQADIVYRNDAGEVTEEADETLYGAQLLEYKAAIAERITHENSFETAAGLMDYFYDNPNISFKVLSATPSVEVRRGYGV